MVSQQHWQELLHLVEEETAMHNISCSKGWKAMEHYCMTGRRSLEASISLQQLQLCSSDSGNQWKAMVTLLL